MSKRPHRHLSIPGARFEFTLDFTRDSYQPRVQFALDPDQARALGDDIRDKLHKLAADAEVSTKDVEFIDDLREMSLLDILVGLGVQTGVAETCIEYVRDAVRREDAAG